MFKVCVKWTAMVLLFSCTPQKKETNPPPTNANASSTSQEISGVDLSRWQGDVDFAKIKGAGKSYVFIKASQGTGEKDPNYQRNITNARAAGLASGSYHFYMTNDKADAQFANFSAIASVQSGDLPPVVDIEALSGNTLPGLAQELMTFLGLIEKKYGVKPIIYSGEDFANDYLKGFAEYPLWLAEYNNLTSPQLPLDWQKWTFWQHTQGGTVPGVEGNVDLDRFNGDHTAFEKLRVKR